MQNDKTGLFVLLVGLILFSSSVAILIETFRGWTAVFPLINIIGLIILGVVLLVFGVIAILGGIALSIETKMVK